LPFSVSSLSKLLELDLHTDTSSLTTLTSSLGLREAIQVVCPLFCQNWWYPIT